MKSNGHGTFDERGISLDQLLSDTSNNDVAKLSQLFCTTN